jgi:hypothetical protein
VRGPDAIFDKVKIYLPAPRRQAVRVSFRRIIREFYIHRSNRVYSAATGLRTDKKVSGAFLKFTGNRLRIIRVFPRKGGPKAKIGRPNNEAVQAVVHRLAALWVIHQGARTTISHRRFMQAPTKWELFVAETLGALGYLNSRKYLERHSKLV